MSEIKPLAASSPPTVPDRDARLRTLLRFIDWAEREAAALGAPDCGLCLQLARVAVQNRQRVDRGDR